MVQLLNIFKLIFILLVYGCCCVRSAPRPEDLGLQAASVAAEDAEADLEGSSSHGFGYYSSPYVGGHYGGFGGYYPYYYGGGYGLGGGYYGLGYPSYGGYYGYHGLHGHYF